MTSLNFYQQVLAKIMQNPVVLDVETTTANKGNVHHLHNRLVTLQTKVGHTNPSVYFNESFLEAKKQVLEASCVIVFNGKFDLAWFKREFGVVPTCIWDCQLAEFLFSNQTKIFPSLENTAQAYGIPGKIDIVKTEYWEKGIDTDKIPKEILAEYGAQDVEVTWQVFLKQVERFKDEQLSKFRLFRLHCNDQLVLLEMEHNGIMYDCAASLSKADTVDAQVSNIIYKLNQFAEGVPINWSSRDHLSVFLYGGTITTETRVPIGVFKSGAKAGQPRFKIIKTDYDIPRKLEPVKGSELAKEGYFSTDESTLMSVKANKTMKKVIEWLLEKVGLEKLNSTYLRKLPKLIEDNVWEPNMIFSTLNQCRVITGRLSSDKPNQQNFPKEAKQFCISRYPC